MLKPISWYQPHRWNKFSKREGATCQQCFVEKRWNFRSLSNYSAGNIFQLIVRNIRRHAVWKRREYWPDLAVTPARSWSGRDKQEALLLLNGTKRRSFWTGWRRWHTFAQYPPVWENQLLDTIYAAKNGEWTACTTRPAAHTNNNWSFVASLPFPSFNADDVQSLKV